MVQFFGSKLRFAKAFENAVFYNFPTRFTVPPIFYPILIVFGVLVRPLYWGATSPQDEKVRYTSLQPPKGSLLHPWALWVPSGSLFWATLWNLFRADLRLETSQSLGTDSPFEKESIGVFFSDFRGIPTGTANILRVYAPFWAVFGTYNGNQSLDSLHSW